MAKDVCGWGGSGGGGGSGGSIGLGLGGGGLGGGSLGGDLNLLVGYGVCMWKLGGCGGLGGVLVSSVGDEVLCLLRVTCRGMGSWMMEALLGILGTVDMLTRVLSHKL